MKSLLIGIFPLCAIFASAQPIIQQISPAAAAPSMHVVITGSGFSGVADSNVVYFGPVRAQVLNASTNSLSAIVPFGATYDYVTVTTQKLTAFSKTRFLPASGMGDTIGTKAFQSRQDVNAGNLCIAMAFADLDGNGQTEVITFNNTASVVRVLKNTSTTSVLILQPLDLPLSSKGSQITVGDLNGDGKQDLIISLDGVSNIGVFLNTSTPGNFSFAPQLTIQTTFAQSGIEVDDIDGDGKVDIIACNQFDSQVSILKNNSSGTSLSFMPPVSFAAYPYPSRIKTGDFDGDGLHDIAVIYLEQYHLSILRNSSTPGTIQFSPKLDFSIPTSANAIAIGDFNSDTKPDLAVGTKTTSFSIFRNTSAGSINFIRQDMVWGNYPMSIGVDDLDGDRKPDLIVAGGESYLSVYQNIGVGDSISFRNAINYTTNNYSNLLSLADLKNTGHPDIVLGCPDRISIHFNQVFQPAIRSFSPSSGTAGSEITIRGKYFTGTTAVVFGQINAKTFSIVSDTVIKATLDVGYTGNIYVYNTQGSVSSDSIFTYVRNPPIIHSVLPNVASAGSVVTLKGRNFDPIPEKNVVKFGAGLGKVISTTDSTLLVSVPKAATYDHISVTRNATTGSSATMFNLTFPGSKGVFTNYTFEHVFDSATAAGPTALALGDFNKDGSTDIALLNTTAGRLSAYWNRADSGKAGFEAAILRSLATGVQGICATDLSGNGRVEFAVGRTGTGGWYRISNPNIEGVYNVYSANSFNFPSKPFIVKCGDLNSNGTPDIVGLSNENGGNSKLQVVRNESAGGFGSYPLGEVLYGDTRPTDLLIDDFDGDGKPDIIVSDSLSGLSLFRNTSADLAISFASRTALTGNTNIQSIAAVDFDKDGHLDIATAGLYNNVRIYRNVSSPGNISFSMIETNIPSQGYRLCVADIDGDGFPDVCLYGIFSNQVMLLRNAGQFPTLFNSSSQISTKKAVYYVQFADLDGNGKPEMITANFTTNSFSVYKNQVGEPVNFALCAGQGGSLTGDATGSSYQWQIDTGNGYQNITDANLYDGFNSNTLIFKTTLSTWYGYRYRLLADGKQSSEYVLKFQNQWTGNANNSWENAGNWSCGAIPEANTDVVINSGSVIINSVITIRSLKINPTVQVTVSTGASVTILH